MKIINRSSHDITYLPIIITTTVISRRRKTRDSSSIIRRNELQLGYHFRPSKMHFSKFDYSPDTKKRVGTRPRQSGPSTILHYHTRRNTIKPQRSPFSRVTKPFLPWVSFTARGYCSHRSSSLMFHRNALYRF